MQVASPSSVGRAYELLVLTVLRKHAFQLYHSGRPGDGGMDLIGHWILPSSRADIVTQCKCHCSPLAPRDVREFESVVWRKSRGQPHSVTGVLASYSGFSGLAMQTGMKSDVPLILTQIRPLSTNSDDITISKNDVIGNSTNPSNPMQGHITDFVLNHVAQTLYPEVSIVWKYKDRVRHILIQVSP